MSVTITTTSLPKAVVGKPYSQTLNAARGTPPYSWSLASGKLPSGLSLTPSSGTISGTPTSSGNNKFTAQVTDSSGSVGKG